MLDRQGYGGDVAMEWMTNLGQIMALLMIGIALGMDAFSLGIGIGMQKLSWAQISKISITIGIFHILMPLIGMVFGHFLSTFIGDIATWVGGIILVMLGANMLWSSFLSNKAHVLDQTVGIGLFLLAFSVSIDALSVGLSLGLFSADFLFVVLLFGIIGGAMTALGLTLGDKIGDWLGDYGEALGGIILLVFGIKFLV